MLPRHLPVLIFLCLATCLIPLRAIASADHQHRIALAEITPGSSLDVLLADMGLLRNQRWALASALSEVRDPRRLRPGQWFAVRFAEDAETVEALVVHLGRGQRAVVERNESGFETLLIDADNNDIERTERFTIEHSLAKSAQDNGVPKAVIAQLTEALSPHLDFERAIHGGEPVRITYKERVAGSGKPTKTLLEFARLALANVILTVARDDDGNWVIDEEDPMAGSFRRPVDVAHITSAFGPRLHPISKTWRQHNGVDYGAPTGTPVYASAPGQISFIGNMRGYGRLIEIRHDGGLKTRYAHLAEFEDGLEEGQSVSIGAQIGAVGQSGLATGPNLHFEVIQHGIPVDPLQVSLAFAPSITSGNQVASAD